MFGHCYMRLGDCQNLTHRRYPRCHRLRQSPLNRQKNHPGIDLLLFSHYLFVYLYCCHHCYYCSFGLRHCSTHFSAGCSVDLHYHNGHHGCGSKLEGILPAGRKFVRRNIKCVSFLQSYRSFYIIMQPL